MELHFADCELCSDALEGLEMTSRATAKKIVSDINFRIESKNISSKKYIWLAAASVLLTFGIGIYLIQNTFQKNEMSLQYEIETQEVKPSETEISEKVEAEFLEEKEESFSKNVAQDKINESIVEVQNQETPSPTFDAKESVAKNEIPQSLDEMEVEAVTVNDAVSSSGAVDYDKNYGGTQPSKTSSEPTIKKDSNIKLQMLAFTEMLLYASNKAEIVSEYISKKEEKSKEEKSSTARSESMDDADYTVKDFEKGVSYYNKEQYKTALSYFEKERLDNEKAKIYIVLSDIMLNKHKEALIEIEGILKNVKHPNYYDALWLKVYILKLQNKNYDLELDLLTKKQNPYYKKSIEIKNE